MFSIWRSLFHEIVGDKVETLHFFVRFSYWNIGLFRKFFLSGKIQSQSKNIFESMSLICLWYNRLTLVAPEYDETYWALTNANKKFMNDFQNLSQALSLPDFDRFKANETLSVCCFIIAIILQTVEWWSLKVIFCHFIDEKDGIASH